MSGGWAEDEEVSVHCDQEDGEGRDEPLTDDDMEGREEEEENTKPERGKEEEIPPEGIEDWIGEEKMCLHCMMAPCVCDMVKVEAKIRLLSQSGCGKEEEDRLEYKKRKRTWTSSSVLETPDKRRRGMTSKEQEETRTNQKGNINKSFKNSSAQDKNNIKVLKFEDEEEKGIVLTRKF